MIPDTFEPPRTQTFAKFQLAVLGPNFAEPDFRAVCASAPSIRGVFGPTNDWPDANITHETNLADLSRHQREFDERVAFAYALLNASGESYLGCLYIKPIKSKRLQDWRKRLFQAQAFLWLSSVQTELSDSAAFTSLQAWLSDSWPFGSVAWPGRVQGWDEWEALANI